MKAVIDGLRYDTDNATEVANASGGESDRDFRHYYEALCVTSSGNWFLAGSGGPMSHYAEVDGNQTSGGSCVSAFTEDEALEWLANHDEVDAVDKYFSDKVKDA